MYWQAAIYYSRNCLNAWRWHFENHKPQTGDGGPSERYALGVAHSPLPLLYVATLPFLVRSILGCTDALSI